MLIDPRHIENAARARNLYLDNLRPDEAAKDWNFAKRQARKLVGQALRASSYLADIEGAVHANGCHTLVFRHMLSPPLSQDQFGLVCPQWSKASEVQSRPVPYKVAVEVAGAIRSRLDHGLVKWVVGTKPALASVYIPLRVVSTVMAVQRVATSRRSRLAFEQEYAVETVLKADGWTKLPSKLIDTRAAVPMKSFMHKTRFATATTSPQEVDIACGLRQSYVLAMECKVTNDETNSVKRVNDVLKKAAAWQSHWGSFVVTAALLQGVVAPKDVQRLTDARVEVFWSHNLDHLRTWLADRLAT